MGLMEAAGGGIGQVAVLITAETKEAIKKLREVEAQTKKTGASAEGASKGLGAKYKKFGIIATAALAAVTGGMYMMLQASSYAAIYTKRWAAESTLIANEWVRRNKDAFDRISNMIVSFRKKYVGEDMGFWEAMGIDDPVKTTHPMLYAYRKMTGFITRLHKLSTDKEKIESMAAHAKDTFSKAIPDPFATFKKASPIISKAITQEIMKFKTAAEDKLAMWNKRLIDYVSLWVNRFIQPIIDILKKIAALIPDISIDVDYTEDSGGGMPGPDSGGNYKGWKIGGSGATGAQSVRSLGTL